MWKCSALIADFLGCRKIFSVINVKSRRDFALSVDGEKSDGSVNWKGESVWP